MNGGYQPRDPGVDRRAAEQFRASNYHQPSDDLTLPLDYPTAADLARVDCASAEAANGAGRPAGTMAISLRKNFAVPVEPAAAH